MGTSGARLSTSAIASIQGAYLPCVSRSAEWSRVCVKTAWMLGTMRAKTLQHFRYIGDAGATALAAALNHNNTIQTIDLRGNQVLQLTPLARTLRPCRCGLTLARRTTAGRGQGCNRVRGSASIQHVANEAGLQWQQGTCKPPLVPIQLLFSIRTPLHHVDLFQVTRAGVISIIGAILGDSYFKPNRTMTEVHHLL
jgi:hypothetical protein